MKGCVDEELGSLDYVIQVYQWVVQCKMCLEYKYK